MRVHVYIYNIYIYTHICIYTHTHTQPIGCKHMVNIQHPAFSKKFLLCSTQVSERWRGSSWNPEAAPWIARWPASQLSERPSDWRARRSRSTSAHHSWERERQWMAMAIWCDLPEMGIPDGFLMGKMMFGDVNGVVDLSISIQWHLRKMGMGNGMEEKMQWNLVDLWEGGKAQWHVHKNTIFQQGKSWRFPPILGTSTNNKINRCWMLNDY